MSNREYESREANQSRNEESSGGFLLGALIGGVVGAAAALLLAPKSGKELRITLSDQAGSIIGKTGQLRENVVNKSNELGLLTKLKGKANSDESAELSDMTYISIQSPNESEAVRKSIEIKPKDSDEIRKRIEEAEKALEEEESKVRL